LIGGGSEPANADHRAAAGRAGRSAWASGAGKSTIAALALKVVAPQQGGVLIGGTDLAALSALDVRSRIA
jgi:ATP-binding cassette subfamily C protein CydC